MFYVEQYWCTCVHYQQRQPRSARIMVDFEADRPKSIQMLRSPDRKIYNTCGVWLSSDGGWGRKCSCCCKCIFIYYPKKKYLPQGASRVPAQGAWVYFFLCPDFPGLPLGPLLRPRFVFLDMIRRFDGLLSSGLPLR